MRNLEKELGAVLFERSSHGVTLTASGGVRGTVTLGIVQAMRTISVPDVLSAFRVEHPDVTVEVRHSGGSPGNAEQVREGRLDLAFLSLPDRRMPGLAVTPLTREPILLAVSPEHPLSGRRSVEFVALSEEVFVEFPVGWGMREANDRAFAAAAVQRTVAYEINDAATVLDFVGHGLAAGMITASAVE